MNAPKLTAFLLVKACPSWLALTREDRRRIAAQAQATIDPDGVVRLRAFDAEALSAVCSDLWMLEGMDLLELYSFTERLRDTPLFAEPYFELVSLIPALEDGFRWFETGQAAAA